MPWRGRKSCTWQQAERHCEGSVGFTIKDFKTKASLVKRRKGGGVGKNGAVGVVERYRMTQRPD